MTYRIGEAAAKLNLKTYVLRFWEMEFDQIRPIRTDKGQRLYTERDLATLRRIRYLLHERGLTIEGARRVLKEESERGVDYTDREMVLPENMPEPLTVLDDVSAAEEEPPSPRGDAVVSPASVQVSLFGEEKMILTHDECRHLVAELMEIRRLLAADAFGEMPQ